MVEQNNELLSFIMNTCVKEFETRPEIKIAVFKPIVNSIIWILLPYLAIFICINVVCVVTAISFVFYFLHKGIGK